MAKCRIKGCTGVPAIAKTPDMAGLCKQHQQTQSARWAQNGAMSKSFDDVWRGHEQGLKDWQADVGRMSEAIVDVLLGEADDAMLRELGAVAMAPNIALQNWDYAINKGFDADAAWLMVFNALGYDGYQYKQMAHTIGEAEWALGEIGDSDEYAREAAQEWNGELVPMFKSFKIPQAHIVALKAVWDRNRKGLREGMVDDVARAGMDSPDAVVRRAWQRGVQKARVSDDRSLALAEPYYGWFEVLKTLAPSDSTSAAAMTFARFQAMIPKGLPADTAWTDASTQLMGMNLTPAHYKALHKLFVGTT